jgi:hypothetical protein
MLVNSTARARFSNSPSATSSIAGADPAAMDPSTSRERMLRNRGRLAAIPNPTQFVQIHRLLDASVTSGFLELNEAGFLAYSSGRALGFSGTFNSS